MRSYALFAVIVATLLFVISLGLTAKDLSSVSTLLSNVNNLGLDNSNPLTSTTSSRISSFTSSTPTTTLDTETETEDTSTEDTSTDDTATETDTSDTTTDSLDTETAATFSNPLTTATDDDEGGIDSALASYSSYLASYSSYLATVNDGGLFGGDGGVATTDAADAGGPAVGDGLPNGRRAVQPTPAAYVGAAMQKRGPQPTPAPAPVQRRHARPSPSLQKRASLPTSVSQAKSRYAAVLAFLALLLVTYVAMIGAAIAFAVLLHRATMSHHHAQAAYLNAGPSTPAGTPHHDLSHSVDEAAYTRTRLFKTFFVTFAALTAVLTLFGVIAFALIGAFFGYGGDGVLAATVAFWVLSVVAAAATCALLLLDRRTSEREEPIGGLDSNGEKTNAFPSTTAATSSAAGVNSPSQSHNDYVAAAGRPQREHSIVGLRRKSSPVVDQQEFASVGQLQQHEQQQHYYAQEPEQQQHYDAHEHEQQHDDSHAQEEQPHYTSFAAADHAQSSPQAAFMHSSPAGARPSSGYTSELQQQQQPSFPSAAFAGNDGPYPSFARRGPLPSVPTSQQQHGDSPAVGQYYRHTFDEQTGVTLQPVHSASPPAPAPLEK